MSRTVKTGVKAIEQIFAEFPSVENGALEWLVEPETGRTHVLHKLYPELGLAFQFTGRHAEPGAQNDSLRRLCRRAGVTLVEVDAHHGLSAQVRRDLNTALSAAARRVAQRPVAQQAKRELMPRIARARAICRQLGRRAVAPPMPYRSSRWQRRKRRAQAGWRRFKISWDVFAQNKLALFGLALIVLFGLMAASHPILRKTVWKQGIYDPITGYDMAILHPARPSPQHLLGTDSLGRDVLSMLLAAAQPAFVVGIAAALTTALLGTTIGVVAAYFGGIVDSVLMHLADAFLLLPAPLLMVIVGMRFRDIGPAPLGLIYGLIAGAGGAAIVMRSQALQVVIKPFIEAARMAGGGRWHIMLVHVVPHMLPLAALYMMLAVTGAVVADAFIAFFGFSRSYLNWGSIIYSSFTYSSVLDTGVEWHVLIPPSVALSLFAAAFYLVARGLHQVADPRLRAR
jgi:peptide/nickel transport system permease protein